MSYEVEYVSYDQLAKEMNRLSTDLHPTELQGVAYAFLSLHQGKRSEGLWAKFLLEEFREIIDEPSFAPLLEMFGLIYRQCEHLLQKDEFNIELCLPDDEVPLGQRLQALSAWCKGFMYGLGISSVPDILKSPDIQEALQDLSSIAEVDVEDMEAEEDEHNFVELVEYVRLIPAMIFQHQNRVVQQETIH